MPKSFSGCGDTRPVSGHNQRKAGAPPTAPKIGALDPPDNRPLSGVSENRGHVKAPRGERGGGMKSIY